MSCAFPLAQRGKELSRHDGRHERKRTEGAGDLVRAQRVFAALELAGDLAPHAGQASEVRLCTISINPSDRKDLPTSPSSRLSAAGAAMALSLASMAANALRLARPL